MSKRFTDVRRVYIYIYVMYQNMSNIKKLTTDEVYEKFNLTQ